MTVRFSWRWARAVFATVAMAGLAIAIATLWDRGSSLPVPEWRQSVVALMALVASLYTSLKAWTALFGGAASAGDLARGYYLSMFGKYVPGGFWQPVGQIVMSSGPSVTGTKAAGAFFAQCSAQVAAGGILALFFGAFGSGASTWSRGVALAGVCAAALLYRGWMQWIVSLIGRVLPRASEVCAADLIPAQRDILLSFAWSILTLGFSGGALALIVNALGGADPSATVGLAFGFAWTVGFLAIPFPSGVAVREAVLVASLSSGAPVILAASVIHRLLTICAETIVVLVARGRR